MKVRIPFLLLCAGLSACATQSNQSSSLPRVPEGEPPGLAGLAATGVKAAYGEPSFVRRDGATEVWRYDGQTCRAFFFLYPSEGTKVVRHVETLPRGTTMAADTTCLDALHGRAKVS
jgi:hypothetical protein